MSRIHLLLIVVYGGVNLCVGVVKHSHHHTHPSNTHPNNGSGVPSNDTTNNTQTGNNMTGIVSAVVGSPDHDDDNDPHRSLFTLGVLIGFCVFAVLAFSMTVVCWVRVFSQPKKPKDQQGFKTKDTERLDTQNMRDVQLTEYEKRKRQMKELDSQDSPARQQDMPESEDEDENDEITAVQSQPPTDEETIVNPNFMHHYQFGSVPSMHSSTTSTRSG